MADVDVVVLVEEVAFCGEAVFFGVAGGEFVGLLGEVGWLQGEVGSYLKKIVLICNELTVS